MIIITILWFHFEETRRPGRTGPAAGARGPGRGGRISTSLWRLGALGEIFGKSVGNLLESGGIWKKCPEISGFFRFMLEKSLFQEISSCFLTEGDIYFMNFHRFFVFFGEGVAGVEISDVKELTPQNSAEWIFVFSPYIFSLSLYI